MEHLLSNEKEERVSEIESNEELQNDLLKRNDSLWSQLANMEQNYKDTVGIVRQQTERIQELETQLRENDANNRSLDDQVKCEKLLNESLAKKSDDLSSKLADAVKHLNDLKVSCEEEKGNYEFQIREKNAAIKMLEENIQQLTGQVNDLGQLVSGLRLDVEAVNKEKSFIIGQNESAHSKVMQDFLALQEKHTDVSYQLNRASKERAEDLGVIRGLRDELGRVQGDRARVEESLRERVKEKDEALEKINYLETLSKKVSFDLFNLIPQKR